MSAFGSFDPSVEIRFVQTSGARLRVVADCAMDGHFHELGGLGHVSVTRHRADRVNRKLEEILDAL